MTRKAMTTNDFSKPPELIARILQTAKTVLPESLADDVRESIKSSLQEVITELDVVSRDEFETQKKVLQKTRAKIDQMENVIAELEKQLGL